MCRNVRVLGIESFMRHFLGIVGILMFCDFSWSLQYLDTPILYSFFRIVKDSLSSVDVGIIGRITLKLSCPFILIFFYLCVLELILLCIKASTLLTNWY